MAWFTRNKVDDTKKQLEEERIQKQELINCISVLESRIRILEMEKKQTKSDGFMNESNYISFENCVLIIKRILKDRYNTIASNKSFNSFREYLQTKKGIVDFDKAVNGEISNLNNLYNLLTVAEQIEDYSEICTLLNKIKPTQLLIDLIAASDNEQLNDLKESFLHAIEMRYQTDKNKKQQLVLKDLLKQNTELEMHLKKEGFKVSTKSLSSSKDIKITRKQGQSDDSNYSMLFASADTYEKAMELYIKNTPQKDLLLSDRLKKLRIALISKGLSSNSITTNELYDYVQKKIFYPNIRF